MCISTDKSKLDIPFIQNFLKDIYWSAGRTIDEVQTTIDASFCFGIYLNSEQIGFARVITDYVVFAYMMDGGFKPSRKRLFVHFTWSYDEGAQIAAGEDLAIGNFWCSFFIQEIWFYSIGTSGENDGKNYINYELRITNYELLFD